MDTNQAIINSIFVMSQFVSDNTERESFDHELAQSIIELIDNYHSESDNANVAMWPDSQIKGHMDTAKADLYRDFVIDRMSVDYPHAQFDQWLAMDAFDLSLSIEDNYAKYMQMYRLEFWTD